MAKIEKENVLGIPHIIRLAFLSGCAATIDMDLPYSEIVKICIPALHEFYTQNKNLIDKCVIDFSREDFNNINPL